MDTGSGQELLMSASADGPSLFGGAECMAAPVWQAVSQRCTTEATSLGKGLGGAVLVLCIALAGACQADSRFAGGMVRDSAGVRVITADLFQVTTVEGRDGVRVVLGTEETPLQAVRDLAWTESGHILVVDAGRTAMIVSRDGELSREVGGVGRGPGEFLGIHIARPLIGGGVLVYDPEGNRVTEYTVAGDVGGTWRPTQRVGEASYIAVLDATPGGALVGVEVPAVVRPNVRRTADTRWSYAPILEVREGAVDTIKEVAVNRCMADPPPSPHGGAVAPSARCVPEGDMAIVAAGDGVLAVAPRDWPEILVFRNGRGHTRTVRANDPELPNFERLLWDDRGRLWFGYRGSAEWWILDGDRFRRVRLPPGFEVWDVAGGRAVGVARDSLSVERVGVLALPPELAG